jgi:fatty acid CoA ligase FadD9
VNHAFSYPQLFEPNVLGTVEVIRLALRRRLARVAFVSSVGVASGLDREDPVREDEDAASLFTRRPVDSGYAVGYATSKWADELLLADLEARAGVPVTIFRCSLILPPRAFVGQVNAGDFLTRLLYGVVVTGLAPRSFYAGPGPHGFDGLPVDLVARSIGTIALDPPSGCSICHVVRGPTASPVSLDTIVDWVEKAGCRVERIADHAAWLRAFRERLEALPPAAQQRSPLAILQQWERPIAREIRFDNRRLRERLAAAQAAQGAQGAGAAPVELPDIDARFVERYLDSMVRLGLIPRGGLSRAA